jgi:hypothetical protein
MRQRTGHVFQRPQTGKLYARVDYTYASGRRRELTRTANDEAHANELLAQLVAQAEQLAKHSPEPAPKWATTNVPSPANITAPATFKTVVDAYSALKAHRAQYRNDRKISGLRSERTVRLRIKVLVEYW